MSHQFYLQGVLWFGSTKTDESSVLSSGVLMVWHHHRFGATKPPAHPEDGEGVRSRNVGKPSHPDAADCQRKLN